MSTVTDRPHDDEVWSRVARVISEKGTCTRLQVGAIIVRDGRPIVSGWNGAPAGQPHCDHDGTEERCTRAIHAERNAIGYAARKGYPVEDATLYVTHAPCLDCSTVVIAAGIARVVYQLAYRSSDGADVLRENGIVVDHQPLIARIREVPAWYVGGTS